MKYCALSEKGKREHNEDSFFIPKHSEVALAAVADGMGGHKAGSTASSLALDVMVKDICRGGERSPEKLIGRAIDAANAAVFDLSKSSDDCRGMGNVGDSRLYHYSEGVLRQISRDHSYVAELVEAGYITREQAAVHPRRNVITRAIGTSPRERADIFSESWKAGDILMLCTDGLSGTLSDEDMCRILKEETELDAACERLVMEAAYGGSTDNISAVLILNEEE